jgi:hypothetical protein
MVGESMVFTIFLFMNLLMLIFFFKFQKKHLHPLEVLVIWMVSSMLYQNYSALFFMNFKNFIIPNVFSLEITHLMNRTVLIPIITIIFLNRYIVIRSFYQRMIFTLFFILFLTGIEKSADFLGVLKHFHWKLWWSIGFWFIYTLLLILIMGIFRKILVKEVGQA